MRPKLLVDDVSTLEQGPPHWNLCMPPFAKLLRSLFFIPRFLPSPTRPPDLRPGGGGGGGGYYPLTPRPYLPLFPVSAVVFARYHSPTAQVSPVSVLAACMTSNDVRYFESILGKRPPLVDTILLPMQSYYNSSEPLSWGFSEMWGSFINYSS